MADHNRIATAECFVTDSFGFYFGGKEKRMTTEEIAMKLASHEQRIVGAEHRIKDLENMQKQIWDLTVSVNELATSVKGMVAEQKEQRKCLDALEAKPGKKWEKASDKIIDVIISGIVGAMLATVLTLISFGL